ncbi:MAG: hypothetical protein MI748_15290 [Opitutales bacterium]|nr:hypothetical protein [Opitutales bacterium]
MKLDFLRKKFDQLKLRERILLTLFLSAACVWWLFEVVASLQQVSTRWTIARLDLDGQSAWLENEASYDQRMLKALENLDSSRTYSGDQLLEIIDEIAREVGLETTISRPTTRTGDVFIEHIIQIPLSRVSMRTLIDFENEIKTHYPYLGIDYLLLESERASSGLLKGDMRVTSFELKKPS